MVSFLGDGVVNLGIPIPDLVHRSGSCSSHPDSRTRVVFGKAFSGRNILALGIKLGRHGSGSGKPWCEKVVEQQKHRTIASATAVSGIYLPAYIFHKNTGDRLVSDSQVLN